MPQESIEGRAPNRSRNGDVSVPRYLISVAVMPGEAQGSDMLGVMREPLAKLVPSAAAPFLSITVTDSPRSDSSWARVVPITPAPMTIVLTARGWPCGPVSCWLSWSPFLRPGVLAWQQFGHMH